MSVGTTWWIFCSLVALLQSSQNSLETVSLSRLCLTRNCIKFQLPGGQPGSLTLIDTFTHFEVHVDAPYDDVGVHFCLFNTANSFQRHSESSRGPRLSPTVSQTSLPLEMWEHPTPCTPSRLVQQVDM